MSTGSSGVTVEGIPPASSVATVGTCRMRGLNSSHCMRTSWGSPVIG